MMNSCLFSSLLIATSIFTFAKSSLLIFRLENVVNLYRWRMSFSTSRFPSDPLEHYTLQRRQKLCDEVIHAEVFQSVPLTINETIPVLATDNAILENFQRTAPTPDDPDPIFLRYTSENRAFKPSGCSSYVKMFPCVHTDEVKWYVTFGFKEEQLFLIEEKFTTSMHHGRRQYLSMTALIEPNSSIDSENWGQQDIRYWSHYIQGRRVEKIASTSTTEAANVPDDMKLKKLYQLWGQPYVRICGSVLEILSSHSIRFFDHNITKSVNYVRNRLKGPKNKPKHGLFQVRVDKEWAHIKTDVFVTCSVARYVFSVLKEYQFFLLANPRTLGSVLVFREVQASPDELEFLTLVYNVPTLKYDDGLGKSPVLSPLLVTQI